MFQKKSAPADMENPKEDAMPGDKAEDPTTKGDKKRKGKVKIIIDFFKGKHPNGK